MESLRQEDSEAPKAEGPARPPRQTARIRVLHVDDDPIYLRLVAEHLQSQDDRFVVATEANAADALQRLEEERFDCIVSDYQMPRMDGLTFLEAVREDRPEMPFILLTGKGSEEIASEAISRGVTDYLQKRPGPDQYRMLANRIDNAVSRRHAEKRAGSILEAAPDSIVIAGSDGRIRRINRQAEELFGYDEEELIGEPIEILIPERYREAHVGHRREYTEDPGTRPMGADVDLYALTRDGEEVPADISLSPMEVGEEAEIVAAIRDISERRWREQEARQRQNARLEEFASVVSHDLRNPLTVIVGDLEVLDDEIDDPRVAEALRAADRMAALIDDLLRLARTGRVVDETEPVSLRELADRAWSMVDADDDRIEIEIAEVEIEADPARLQELLENLLRNAVDHGGDATVRVAPLPGGRGFLVEDGGPGIPAGERDRVFEAGYSTDDRGTGFGLSIVARIAEAHGWSVRVTEGDAGGARFEIRVDGGQVS